MVGVEFRRAEGVVTVRLGPGLGVLGADRGVKGIAVDNCGIACGTGKGAAIAIGEVRVQPLRTVVLGIVESRFGELGQDLWNRVVVPQVADPGSALGVTIAALTGQGERGQHRIAVEDGLGVLAAAG